MSIERMAPRPQHLSAFGGLGRHPLGDIRIVFKRKLKEFLDFWAIEEVDLNNPHDYSRIKPFFNNPIEPYHSIEMRTIITWPKQGKTRMPIKRLTGDSPYSGICRDC